MQNYSDHVVKYDIEFDPTNKYDSVIDCFKICKGFLENDLLHISTMGTTLSISLSRPE